MKDMFIREGWIKKEEPSVKRLLIIEQSLAEFTRPGLELTQIKRE